MRPFVPQMSASVVQSERNVENNCASFPSLYLNVTAHCSSVFPAVNIASAVMLSGLPKKNKAVNTL